MAYPGYAQILRILRFSRNYEKKLRFCHDQVHVIQTKLNFDIFKFDIFKIIFGFTKFSKF